MYPTLRVLRLPTHWDIRPKPLVDDTHLPFWVWTKYPSPLTARNNSQVGYWRVYCTVEALPYDTARKISPNHWCWHWFLATSSTPLLFVTLLLFHGARSAHVQLPLFSISAPYWLTPLLAVHWFSATGRVLHLKQGISWLPTEIAAFPSKFFFSAASGSPDIHLFPSISFCIPLPVLTQQMVHVLSPASFVLVDIPHLFPI